MTTKHDVLENRIAELTRRREELSVGLHEIEKRSEALAEKLSGALLDGKDGQAIMHELASLGDLLNAQRAAITMANDRIMDCQTQILDEHREAAEQEYRALAASIRARIKGLAVQLQEFSDSIEAAYALRGRMDTVGLQYGIERHSFLDVADDEGIDAFLFFQHLDLPGRLKNFNKRFAALAQGSQKQTKK